MMNEFKTADDILQYLKKYTIFQEFFVAVCKLKVEFSSNKLTLLLEALDHFNRMYGVETITYLKDIVICEKVLPCKNPVYRKNKEAELQRKICRNFNRIFPEFTLIGNEIPVKGIGRIDILAKDRLTNKHVIIELKVDGKNPTQQLLSYSHAFFEPILIGISDVQFGKEKMRKGIKYLTYTDIGVT